MKKGTDTKEEQQPDPEAEQKTEEPTTDTEQDQIIADLKALVDSLNAELAEVETREKVDRRTEVFVASDGTKFHPDERCDGWRVGNTLISEVALGEFFGA